MMLALRPAPQLHPWRPCNRGGCPVLSHTLFYSCPQVEDFRATMAQRLVRMLQICAGHVPGVSAMSLLSLLRSSESPFLEDL